MKIRSKALLLPLCAILLVIVSALGTVAYLTSKAAVTNTFTVGQVDITLDEDSVNTRRAAAPVDGNSCTLMPGHTYAKAHTIHVDAVSEDSYIFAKVENGIAVYEAASSAEKDGYKTIADQLKANGWTALEGTAEGIHQKQHRFRLCCVPQLQDRRSRKRHGELGQLRCKGDCYRLRRTTGRL